jgi:uncharacterized protein
MKKYYRTILLGVFITTLLFISLKISGKIFPNGENSIWFHSGLLMVILGMYWVEHYFTKPQDVFSNGLVGFIAISILENPPFPLYWNLLRYYSLALSILSLLIILAGTPANQQNDTSKLKKFIYDIVIRFGNSQILFSAIFILSLISFFEGRTPEIQGMLVFWVIVLSFKYLDLEGIVENLLSDRFREQPIGIMTKIIDPNIVRFTLNESEACGKGELVAFTERGVLDNTSPVGVVTGYRKSPNEVEVETIILDSNFNEGKIDKRIVVVKIPKENNYIDSRKKENPLLTNLKNLIGFVFKGSDVSRIFFEIVNKLPVETGHLVSVPGKGDTNIYYQVINAKLAREDTIRLNERVYAVCEAEQIGIWNQVNQGFDTFNWIAKENSPVLYAPRQNNGGFDNSDHLNLGFVPNSDFPIKVNLNDLILHHSAILGVTGCGKTYLAYQVIEQCIKEKIKVICLDITGDYKRYLKDAVLLSDFSPTNLHKFLDSPDYFCAIIEPPENPHPIANTKIITENILKWCKSKRSDEEIAVPKAKILLVYEEAHVLVPEFNFNPDRTLQERVNDTARIVLQARKYGLGFMVIAQRTANVTKSILNQCNTIFAFQAFDKTSFEFLQNYMGEHWIDTIPNLLKQQTIVVGKASLSKRPIIAELHKTERALGNGKLIVFPPQPKLPTMGEIPF